MKYSTKLLSQSLVQICDAKEIHNIIISPGSRNAPLIIGFTENSNFNNFSIVDERSAAFFALGIAQQIKKPVALVCTSGSAMLNYYPAIAESFYSDIPLVVISADRPKKLINIGDGQTIKQEDVFVNHILYSANCKEGDEHLVTNENEINKALNIAIEQQGPVHINIPLAEPLYKTTEELMVNPSIIPLTNLNQNSSEDLQPYFNIWNAAKKKIILVGVMQPNSVEQELLNKLAEDTSVIVLTETTSNLHHDNFFSAIDQLIASLEEDGFKKLQPDILLTFGGMIVSKKIKTFLRKYSPKEHWHVDSKKAFDTYFNLKHHFKTTPNKFLKEFLPKTKMVESSFQKDWQIIKEHRLNRHSKYINEIPFSDFKVFSEIVNTLPNNIQLQLSNSATIRYAQLFNINKNIEIYCNRGTSGIDGCTSTAVGAAVASEKPTVFITGDLSFLYDSNALWNNYIPDNFKIIVINNGGGGIFRILPGDKNTDKFNTYFETKHQLNASKLAAMYGLEYTSVKNKNELNCTLQEFFKVSDKVLLDYFRFIK